MVRSQACSNDACMHRFAVVDFQTLTRHAISSDDSERWSQLIGALGGQDVWQRLTSLHCCLIGTGRTGIAGRRSAGQAWRLRLEPHRPRCTGTPQSRRHGCGDNAGSWPAQSRSHCRASATRLSAHAHCGLIPECNDARSTELGKSGRRPHLLCGQRSCAFSHGGSRHRNGRVLMYASRLRMAFIERKEVTHSKKHVSIK